MGILGNRSRDKQRGGVLGQKERMGQYKPTANYALRAEAAQKGVSDTAQAQTTKGSKTEHKKSDLSTGLEVLTAAATLGSVAAGVMKANEMKKEDLEGAEKENRTDSGVMDAGPDNKPNDVISNARETAKKDDKTAGLKGSETKRTPVEQKAEEVVNMVADDAAKISAGDVAQDTPMAVDNVETIGSGVESIQALEDGTNWMNAFDNDLSLWGTY